MQTSVNKNTRLCWLEADGDAGPLRTVCSSSLRWDLKNSQSSRSIFCFAFIAVWSREKTIWMTIESQGSLLSYRNSGFKATGRKIRHAKCQHQRRNCTLNHGSYIWIGWGSSANGQTQSYVRNANNSHSCSNSVFSIYSTIFVDFTLLQKESNPCIKGISKDDCSISCLWYWCLNRVHVSHDRSWKSRINDSQTNH